METISCHSNQSSYPTEIKNITFVEGNVLGKYAKFRLHFAVFPTGSFCQVYRVTDDALIAETAVWPNFYLMNIFFALKGSKLFIIIHPPYRF